MKAIAGLISLVFMCCVVNSSWAASTCADIKCDCESIVEGKWRNVCLAREAIIRTDCVSNSGKPRSYCGLHGPEAYPVATSIQFSDRPKLGSDLDPKALSNLVDPQMWSLVDDLKVLKKRESEGEYPDAVQIFSLLKKNAKKLYQLQETIVYGYLNKGEPRLSEKLARSYAESTAEFAASLEAYSVNLWQTLNLATNKDKKAYKLLSFKIARESATAHERAASFFSAADRHQESAVSWRAASAVAKTLLDWESATTNNGKYIVYYQEQAAARLNRATYHWIQANDEEKISETFIAENSGLPNAEVKALIETAVVSDPTP